MLTRTYLPETEATASLERLGSVVGNFIETIDHNRREDDPEKRLFERIAVADSGVSPEDLPLFKAYVKTRSQLLLEEIDNWLSQLEPSSSTANREKIMTGVGIYHYVEGQDKN